MTSRTHLKHLLQGLLIVALIASNLPESYPCAPAPSYRLLPDGTRVYPDIGVTTEDVLIVWDAASETQHFIRRARFRAGGRRCNGL
jgi:hypothetical protein